MRVIGLCGKIGAGKTTAADILKSHGYIELSFAKILKDVVAILFDWDRARLDGTTQNDRQWRNTRDEWWCQRLHLPITPRWVLQQFGTDIMRDCFHSEFWLARLEKSIAEMPVDSRIVVSDCRFENEVNLIRLLGGDVYYIKRGADLDQSDHISEHIDVSQFSRVIDNSGSIEDLHDAIKILL